MRGELVGLVAAVADLLPVELLLEHRAVVGLDVGEECRDPARDERPAGPAAELVDRTPEVLVRLGAVGGLRDRLQDRQQAGKVAVQAPELAGQSHGAAVQVAPVGRGALQADLWDAAHGLPLEVVVRAGGVHERDQQRGLVLGGRGREARQEKLHGAVTDLGGERVAHQVDGPLPVGRLVVAEAVVADLDGLLRLRRVREQARARGRVLSHVLGDLVDDEVPRGVGTETERDVCGECLVDGLDSETYGGHRVGGAVEGLVAAVALDRHVHDVQLVAAAVVKPPRLAEHGSEEVLVAAQLGRGAGGRVVVLAVAGPLDGRVDDDGHLTFSFDEKYTADYAEVDL